MDQYKITMQKRILVDHLVWYCESLKKGDIIKLEVSSKYWYNIHTNIGSGVPDKCIKQNPDWFEDIEEIKSIKEEEKYVILFANYIDGEIRFNKSITRSQEKLIIQTLNGESFNREDIIDFAKNMRRYFNSFRNPDITIQTIYKRWFIQRRK